MVIRKNVGLKYKTLSELTPLEIPRVDFYDVSLTYVRWRRVRLTASNTYSVMPHITPMLQTWELDTPPERGFLHFLFFFLLLATSQVCRTAGVYCLAQGHTNWNCVCLVPDHTRPDDLASFRSYTRLICISTSNFICFFFCLPSCEKKCYC